MACYSLYKGSHKAGIGSLLQIQQHLYAYTRINNLKFYFPGFSDLAHWEYTNFSQQEYCNALNKFFNFPTIDNNENLEFIDDNQLIKQWGEQFNNQKQKYIKELASFIQYEGKLYFDPNKTSVTLHIRTVNPQDNDLAPSRELYNKNKVPYYINLLNNIKSIHGEDLDIHVFSQGDKKDFQFLVDTHNATLHINDNILATIYHLIFSNILLTANSSLSWSAHLYGQNNVVYARPTFSHSWYPGTNLIQII
jgi:hypothetical protein